MEALRRRLGEAGRDERGFTLYELIVVIVIMGILIAIAVVIWLGILEQRRVDAATNQLKADMRLAHTSATNRLTDWRIVLAPGREGEEDGPDYYVVALAAPYPAVAALEATKTTPRTFPGGVKIVNIAGALDGEAGWLAGPSAAGETRTVEFNSDGTMRFYGAVSGSTCVTQDGDPENRVVVTAATSRVKVKPDAC